MIALEFYWEFMGSLQYVSKSDFKAARECPTKLYYRKKKYPDLKKEDEFLQFLAEGGFMVGKLAQLLFPGGIEIPGGRDHEAAVAKTREYLSQDKITLFEPAIYVEGMLIRADVLIKRGNSFDLIEVKAKSIDGDACEKREKGGTSTFWKSRDPGLASEWQPYLEDAAFQTLVLQRAFPDAEIRPFLMLCDKSQQTSIDNLLQQFILHRIEDKNGNESFNVEFVGDVEALRKDHLLIQIDVLPEVEYLLPEVKKATETFVASVIEDKKIQGPLSTECKTCEYRQPLDQKEKNGFLECWGKLATVSPHLLELRKLGSIKENKEQVATTLFAKGVASLFEIPTAFLGDGTDGDWRKRQIEYTKKNQEWISPNLKDLLKSHKYPLQFIDFETTRMALPYHKGMRPYGQVAFQWSCHTIRAPGEAPQHTEWINTKDTFPNIEFAQTLMKCLGRDGTVFMWWPHERSVLRDITATIQKGDRPFPELVSWLTWMQEKLVDQCKIASDNYYHPDMKGSASIKFVLPAVWNNNPYLHQVEYFRPYYKEVDGKVLNPYETLEKIDIAEEAEVIKEGTGAMRAYEQMMYGLYRGEPETHKKWTDLLRQYCALDTMAMVIIYRHWCSKVGIEF